VAASDQRSCRAMTLLTDLEQFASGYSPHGPLTADATPPA